MKPTGLIFDFDGVIALSEGLHFRAWEDQAREMGRALPDRFFEQSMGKSESSVAEGLAKDWDLADEAEQILDQKRRHYRDLAAREGVLVPGVAEALAELSRSFRIAVATSSAPGDIEPYLERYDLGKYFSAVLTIESIVRPKPDPEIYLKAAGLLQSNAGDCIVFEDSKPGADAARGAGARVIGITTSLPGEALAPVLAHFADFKDLDSIRRAIEQ